MKPVKPPMTVTEQIDLLRSRGMDVDADLAGQWLLNVSYYRLSAYSYPARVLDGGNGRRGDVLADGTTFADVVRLYEADRKLRTLVHDGMERVEVALRARVGELLCAENPLRYTEPGRFRPAFDHGGWMNTAVKRISRAQRHSESIKHYQRDYGSFPFWVLADVLDFADVSRLYEGLPASDQREIAEGLNVWIDMEALTASQRRKAKAQSPLVRWMEQLTIVRNTCAHHGRLWNKSFTPAPTAALRTNDALIRLPEGQSERVFGSLTVMAHLLRTISTGTTWPTKVADLLHSAFLMNSLVSGASLGIPGDWDRAL